MLALEDVDSFIDFDQQKLSNKMQRQDREEGYNYSNQHAQKTQSSKRKPVKRSHSVLSEESSADEVNNDELQLHQGEQTQLQNEYDSTQLPAYTQYQSTLNQLTNSSLYDPNQQQQAVSQIRSSYSDLFSKLSTNKKDLALPDSNELSSFVEESTRIYQNVKSTNEATLDSRLLVLSSEIGAEKVHHLCTSKNLFTVGDLVRKLKGYLCMYEQEENCGSALNQGLEYRRERFCQIGRISRANSLSVGCVDSFLGQMRHITDLKERKRRELNRKFVESEECHHQTLHATTTSSNDVSLLIQEQIAQNDTMNNIVAVYESLANTGPLNFFQFFVNPHSFPQSVENLFYCSFLLREEKARIYHNQQLNVPFIECLDEDEQIDAVGQDAHSSSFPADHDGKKEKTAKNQILMEFDHQVWTRAIQKYRLDSCVIPNRTLCNPTPSSYSE